MCTMHLPFCTVVGFLGFCVDLWLESGDSFASNLCAMTFNSKGEDITIISAQYQSLEIVSELYVD